MELKTYFYETYALHEIISGNPAYKKYTAGVAAITTKLNLMELYYGLLLKYGKKTAEKYYQEFAEYAIEIDDDAIKKAMELKQTLKNKNLSYVDCIGYTLAQQRNIKFLTGDRQFQNMPNVEHVK